jgi:hypothetical protein
VALRTRCCIMVMCGTRERGQPRKERYKRNVSDMGGVLAAGVEGKKARGAWGTGVCLLTRLGSRFCGFQGVIGACQIPNSNQS